MKELLAFLELHKNPTVRTASTIKSGCIVCISPIPTICGAEVLCNSNVYNDVVRAIRDK
jgi:hypothetical protein